VDTDNKPSAPSHPDMRDRDRDEWYRTRQRMAEVVLGKQEVGEAEVGGGWQQQRKQGHSFTLRHH
jgi:hypothetical protein